MKLGFEQHSIRLRNPEPYDRITLIEPGFQPGFQLRFQLG